MRHLRKTAMSMMVWMTAASTLIGSTSHTVCQCPDGTVKLFCGGTASAESSCCCGAKCCSSKNGGSGCCCKPASSKQTGGKPSCCGKKSDKPTASEPSSNGCGKGARTAPNVAEGPTVGGTCCQKTLVQADGPSLSRPETKPTEGSPSDSLLFSLAPTGHFVLATIAEKTGWRVDHPPPPTDLITVLQHITI